MTWWPMPHPAAPDSQPCGKYCWKHSAFTPITPPTTRPKPYQGSVLDGRDIGTIVCPNADIKLYITAKVEIRAQRRFQELVQKGVNTTYDTVLHEMMDRDARDSGRESAPLKPAHDAIILDTSDLNADAAFEAATSVVRAKLS